MAKGGPLAALAAIIGFVAATFAYAKLRDCNTTPPHAAADGPWLTQTVHAATFETPWELREAKLQPPPQLAAVAESVTTWTGEHDGVFVQVWFAHFNATAAMDLDGAVQGAIANMRAVPGTRSFVPHTTEAKLLGVRAVDVEAQAERDSSKIPFHVHVTMFVIDRDMYMFMFASDVSVPGADAAWDHLRHSIRASGH